METNLVDFKHQDTSIDQQQEKPVENDHDDSLLSLEEEEEADTYPLCDNEPTSESISSAKPDTDQVEELRVKTSIETLHFENACLQASNQVQLHLQCASYEHIEIIRVIYGYSKQSSMDQCQFSIYDCIQEGGSRHILSCTGKQKCSINMTKEEIHSSTVKNQGVPTCPQLNYVQVNFACVPDAKDICDSWKEDGPTIHLSHVDSNNQEYHQCQCTVRSSLTNGQVLLHAKDIYRQTGNPEDSKAAKAGINDCKKTTYLEIATDRSERKCMDNLPSGGNALFGSGSHNFTLTYVRNDPLTELFFFFELKASPTKKDHHVQISCNWARRTTTTKTTTRRATKASRHRRRSTTQSVLRGGQLSRLDLIRHETNEEESESVNDNDDEIDNGDDEISSTIVSREDEQWPAFDSLSSHDDLFSSENRTYISSAQASVLAQEEKSSHRLSNKRILRIFLITTAITVPLFLLCCVLVRKPHCIQRLRMHIHLALIFCCEASKLLFTSSPTPSSVPTETFTHHRSSYSVPVIDYQSSEYYMNDTMGNGHMTPSIYDAASEGRDSYSSMRDDRLSALRRYDPYQQGDSC